MDDLISRQAAIDAVREKVFHNLTDEFYGTMQVLDELPSAQRWIPCSERLPDDLAEVNVTWVNHEPESYYGFMKDKPMTATAVYYRGKWYWFSCLCTDMLAEYGKNPLDQMDDAIEVIAWMPLPEPYKGE